MTEEDNGKTLETENKVDIKATHIEEPGDSDTETKSGPNGSSETVEEAPRDRRGDRHESGGGRYGGRGYRDSRPLSNDDKLKLYKKQSEERLLDIKRSREAKIGKRRIR